jgi:hypothetical protein
VTLGRKICEKGWNKRRAEEKKIEKLRKAFPSYVAGWDESS